MKAYQRKKGTTTDKCAASAESDVFIQTVALLDAVIPQTARRCDLLDWPLLRAATIAFTTMSLGNIRANTYYEVLDCGLAASFGKGHLYGCRPETWCPDAVQLCQSRIVQQLHGIGASCFLHPGQPEKVIVLSIADASAILRTISLRRNQSLFRLSIGYASSMLNLSADTVFLSFFLVHFNKKQYLCNRKWGR